MGAKRAVVPKISPILAIFEPSAFPNAMPGLPSKAAITETSISGALVPKPTITIPMSKVGIPKCLAVATAPRMNLSALQTKRVSPTIIATLNPIMHNLFEQETPQSQLLQPFLLP